jgi:hypothetical protein
VAGLLPLCASGSSARRGLALILGLYLLLALAYGVATPLFEAPDEDHHYFNAQRIAETWTLPRLEPGTIRAQEAAQPPLYYVMAAAIIAPIATDGADDLLWRNPHTRFAYPNTLANLNAYVHVPAVEGWPWQGHALAVHLLRALSALIGLGTLYCVYAIGSLFWPDARNKALLATALVAFLPQFGFLHGAVSNDPLVIFLCTACLWQLMALWRMPASPPRLLALGATLGLAILSKMSGLLLTVFAAGVLILRAWRDAAWRRLAGNVALVLVPVALLAGWLLWRNWLLYGDVTAANQFVEWGGGDRGFTLLDALADAARVRPSFFAVFGWLNLYAPSWVYLSWYALLAFGLLGAVGPSLRRGLPRAAGRSRARARDASSPASVSIPSLLRRPWVAGLLLGLWLGLLFASWLRFLMTTFGGQGRLMFPALAPAALFLAHGLAAYRRAWITGVAPLLAFATSVYCVGVVIPEAYAPPPLIAEAAIPPSATRFHADMGERLELVAAELEPRVAHPTALVWLTSYWRRHAPAVAAPHLHGRELRGVPQAPRLVVELHVGERKLLQTGGYHAGGLYPATLWPEGAIVVDRRPLRLLFGPMPGPTRARFVLTLRDGTRRVEAATLKVDPRRGDGG